MKFKAKAKDCQLLVSANFSSTEILDEKELDKFSRIYLRGFLKAKFIKKDLIEYTGPIGISLAERLSRPINKHDFLLILEQIVVAVQKIHANKLKLHNLVMDPQHIYINEATKEVNFIYLPSTGFQNFNLILLFNTIAYSSNPLDEKDTDFVARFVHHFKSMGIFNIAKIEEFVAREDRSVISTIKKQNAGQSGFMTNKPQHYYEHYDEKHQEQNDEPTGLLTEDDPTGLLIENADIAPVQNTNPIDEATGLLVEPTYQEDEATGLLYNDFSDEGEATGLLCDDETEATGLLVESEKTVRFPKLFRILTNETVNINKPVFRLGKEKSYVDYFIANNVAVSRSHADIITRGSSYFIKDLNSKNHTYINNQEIPIHVEIEIHDGDRLKLANEEFIFIL